MARHIDQQQEIIAGDIAEGGRTVAAMKPARSYLSRR